MATSATQSARDVFSITPSNTTNLPKEARAVFIGTGGNLKITTQYNKTVVFKNLVRGYILPVQVMKVWEDETTAQDLIGLL